MWSRASIDVMSHMYSIYTCDSPHVVSHKYYREPHEPHVVSHMYTIYREPHVVRHMYTCTPSIDVAL